MSEALGTKRNNTGAAGSSVPAHELAGASGPLKEKRSQDSEWTSVHPERREQLHNAAADDVNDEDGDMEKDPLDEIAFLTQPVDGGQSETDKEDQPTSGPSDQEGQSQALTRQKLSLIHI